MILLVIISSLVALFSTLFFIRWARGHAQRYDHNKPQRFHLKDTPRIGGAGILLGLLSGWLALVILEYFPLTAVNVQGNWRSIYPWILVVIPSVLGGIYEDLTQRLSVKYRLLLTTISGILAYALLGVTITRLSIVGVDGFLNYSPIVGGVFAIFAIAGLPHAFNIIDGYNGLAATVALMISLALVHVALQLGDRQLAAVIVCLSGATAGFLFWNYPRGLIFAGDGGAYLWGTVIAVGSIMLVQRHPTVSPWFPMLLVIYPVWETLFSIYRKVVRGVSPGMADALHFHQLIYSRIVRGVFHDDASRQMLMRNNRTSPWLWSFTLFAIIPAVVFWNNTPVLVILCILFAITYVLAYNAIIKFKLPKWLNKK